MNTEDKLRALAEEHLAGNRRFDGVRFIDEILAVVTEVGELRCSLAGEHLLRFQAPSHPTWDIELERAKPKLRMLCARLGVLCNEQRGQDVSLYGGEGLIARECSAFPPGTESTNGIGHAPCVSRGNDRPTDTWNVSFKNTPDEQHFAISAYRNGGVHTCA